MFLNYDHTLTTNHQPLTSLPRPTFTKLWSKVCLYTTEYFLNSSSGGFVCHLAHAILGSLVFIQYENYIVLLERSNFFNLWMKRGIRVR